MSYITKDDYTEDRSRPKILANYLDQMCKYLKLQNPNADADVIEKFVKSQIKKHAKIPQVEFVHHKTEGNDDIRTLSLDKFVTEIVADSNLSPSGSMYYQISKKESFLRRTVEGKIKARNAFKKLYLDFAAKGMAREADYYHKAQANAKIFNNAITGGMLVVQFILGCKAGFNAITSVGRISVKQGYSFIERAVNGNIYLPTTDEVISYIVNQSRAVHKDFPTIMAKYRIYVPTCDDVFKYLLKSLEHYLYKPDTTAIELCIANLTDMERAYVFYVGCLSNLCKFNEAPMKGWIDSCFLQRPIDPSLFANIDIDDIKLFKGDVMTLMLTTNYQVLGRMVDKPDRWNSPKDAAKTNPEGLKEFIYIGKHFLKNFERFVPALKTIMQINITLPKLTNQNKMARETVPLSDTDSNIFSTQELVRWKRGKLDFSQESYEMNALVTFILSQSLEHVFAKLSSGFGCDPKDIFRISMKNEFLYPILISTALSKHYLAIATMQEGFLLPTPRRDIKGVGFRSSTYPKPIKDRFDDFVVDLFSKIQEGNQIRAAEVLQHVCDTERMIYDSISNSESTYLQTVSIKDEADYKDADKSSYFYYKMWEEVFAPDFGEMVIPNKCYKIPLVDGKKFFKNKEYMDKIARGYPDIYKRLMNFISNNPKRDISAILIPPFKGNTNQFFLDVLDRRGQISKIMTGYYHLLNGLGIGTVYTKYNCLVSDWFDPNSFMIK